jgi:hypothetical protein
MTIGGRNKRLGEEVEDKDAYIYKKLKVEVLIFTSKSIEPRNGNDKLSILIYLSCVMDDFLLSVFQYIVSLGSISCMILRRSRVCNMLESRYYGLLF